MIIRMRYQNSGAHMRVRVFVGETAETLAFAGNLTLRLKEWPVFCDKMQRAGCEMVAEGKVFTRTLKTRDGETVDLVEADPSFQRNTLR